MRKQREFIIVTALCFLLLYFLRPILSPFLMGFILAYLGMPLVDRFKKWGMPRVLAACLVLFFFLFIVAMIFVLLLPILERQGLLLYNKIPVFITWAQDHFFPWLSDRWGFEKDASLDYLKKAISNNMQQTGNAVFTVWKTLSHSGIVILETLFSCLLVPVVMFYLLRDWNKVWEGLGDLFPDSIRSRLKKFVKEIDEVLGAFLQGQLIVILCLGLIYSVGLWMVGLDSALLVGLFAGIINIVPYLGLIVGMTIASLMMLIQYHDVIHVVYAVLVFLIGAGIDNSVLTPNLIGERIGLHPIAVIFAVLVGGHAFGLVGVLLALPVASIIMVFLRHLRTDLARS
ncbi:MAG: hypothetical protein A3I12_00285 [Gammaproteobacteria bacterium RIFCSPLOWO2_02_FULL_38_11]|nr:MAG: hypothetical protein A3B69_06085 [Gammaproteobacteria bacterium RIFCSPHIGHO2_02_FULL_38_33]OGT24385.1 MAG: hypothetical protein A2W47_02360 [Gammaproteobacteria bacterium RIFCSPHIGHO2_12_38_15]OGT68610.1 MAG: hypothetical protein A3I12_00285 [Gammaproteobacteria bacterium RIFCSPLOWO2_02_FULL_38_11]OGT75612.1 MAG: hypothetical protein A3G71_00435 [Gammaproteobacteria bacterium RIFCSPLOWO2_12_FULL_38_14]